MERKYLQHLDETQPFQWLIRRVANVMIASMYLSIYRPLTQIVPPTPSYNLPNVLALSVDVLEQHSAFVTAPPGKTIKWLSASYVQWHPLAITLAELCVQTEGPLVDRAWKYVDKYFGLVASQIADTSRGSRWQPIRKLMAKAKKARQNYLQQHAGMAGPGISLSPSDNKLFTATQDTLALDPNATHSTRQDHPYGYQYGGSAVLASATSAPQNAFNWDPWLIPNVSSTGAYNNADMNQSAWASWESFVDDFQGDSYMQGLEFSPDLEL
jgi:hypothetical protein